MKLFKSIPFGRFLSNESDSVEDPANDATLFWDEAKEGLNAESSIIPSHQVFVTPTVVEQLRQEQISEEQRVRIRDTIDNLAIDPEAIGRETLTSPIDGFGNLFRVRAGDYGIVYSIPDESTVKVIMIRGKDSADL